MWFEQRALLPLFLLTVITTIHLPHTMAHRLFFAINIPDHIRQELVQYQEQWRRYPVRWTKPENLHFTVLFLGTVDDERLAILRRKAKELLRDFQPLCR